MGLIVQKYGGTSMAGAERIRNVARRVVDTQKRGHDVVVVVSAMAGVTDQLVAMANEISPSPDPREYDMLVSTGEQQTIALLAMAIQALGARARSFTSAQVKVYTDDDHARARIHRIDTERIREELAAGGIVVLPGFQGVTDEGDITTLGRGGSDTSAVAFGAALGADVCEIYTTTGVSQRSAIARAASSRGLLRRDSRDGSLGEGAAVRSANRQYSVAIHVREFSAGEGTWVVRRRMIERLVASGVTYNRRGEVTIFGVPDVPGIAAKIFGPLSESGIVVDMIVQNVSTEGHTDMTFTVARGDMKRALALVEDVGRDLGAAGVKSDSGIAKVSVVGLGMKDHAGVAGKMFAVLSHHAINIQMINTSEIKISVVIDEKFTELACRALHDAFELGATPAEPEEA
jgi:aspartate kinase